MPVSAALPTGTGIHLVTCGKRCAPHPRNALLVCFWPKLLARHSFVGVPSLRGVTWVRSAFFFSTSPSFPNPIFFLGFLLTDSFYSSQVFLVIDLSDQSRRLNQVPALFETIGTVRALPALSLIVSSRFFPALRPSAHFVARCRGKPRTRPLLGAGLRIGPPVFVAALSFFSTAVSHLFFGAA